MKSELALAVMLSTSALAADRTALATGFVNLLVAEKNAEAAASFDETMKGALSVEKLGATWKQVIGAQGAFKSIEGTKAITEGPFNSVLVRVGFEKGPLDTKVVFDAKDRIAGLRFLPTAAPSEYLKPDGKPLAAPTPPPAGVKEVELTLGTEWPLGATLSLPTAKGRVPAVVLVHGSGPADRDETVGGTKVFRDLAWMLSSQGVAVLRYEKRSKPHGARLTANKTFTVNDEVLDDALLAVALMKTRPEVDPKKIFVLGHSLGGYLAPRIAAGDPSVAGLVILAGSARPLQKLVLDQTKYLSAVPGAGAQEKAALAMLEKEVARADAVTDAGTPGLIMGAPAAYWLDLRTYDPVATAKTLKVPMLFLQGGRDYQVTAPDWAAWKTLEGNKALSFKLWPELNHLFVAGTGPSTPAEYAIDGHVFPAVGKEIATWIKARR